MSRSGCVALFIYSIKTRKLVISDCDLHKYLQQTIKNNSLEGSWWSEYVILFVINLAISFTKLAFHIFKLYCLVLIYFSGKSAFTSIHEGSNMISKTFDVARFTENTLISGIRFFLATLSHILIKPCLFCFFKPMGCFSGSNPIQ